MNDRIKALADQAGIGWDDKYHWYISASQMEQYTKLLIREAMSQVYRQTKMATPEHNWTDREEGYNEGVRAAYKQIKDHFGLK